MNEKQAFDLKDLEEKLKANGMPIVEGAAKAVVKSVFDWIEESVKLSPSKVDDLSLAVLPPLRSFVDSQLDKISE